MKTIYSFVPVKKRMKILEFINYHLQRHPSCELNEVVFSPEGTHLVLKFLGLEGVSLLIPWHPNQHQYYTIIQHSTKEFFELEDAFFELETLLIWRYTT